MSLEQKHPNYAAMMPDWAVARDTHAGERAVKERSQPALPGQSSSWAGTCYLPTTSSQIADGIAHGGDRGALDYDAYKKRAVYPSFVSEAVKAAIGVMHSKPPVIELPPQLEPMLEKATFNGESLQMLLRRINEQQMIVGGIGLLLDLPDKPTRDSVLPYIATYERESIWNWDSGASDETQLQALNLVVLDESGYERQADFSWQKVPSYRVLVLGDVLANESDGIYRAARIVGSAEFDPTALTEPSYRGNTLNQIPFVCINSTDILPDPLAPPFLELSNLCLTIYRGEADYRLNLYQQSLDTLVEIGGDPAQQTRLGPGGKICPPDGGDAKFIGVTGIGLPEQRQALENDYRRAAEMAMKLLDTSSRQKESGEALRIRVAATTATLTQIAMAGAEGLQTLLRMAARWVGADPEQVIVTPNLDFGEAGLTAAEILALSQARSQYNLPLSDEEMHDLLVEADLTAKDWKEVAVLLVAEKEQRMADAMEAAKAMGVQGNNQPPDREQGAAA